MTDVNPYTEITDPDEFRRNLAKYITPSRGQVESALRRFNERATFTAAPHGERP